jgi:NAD(P)-dependent dehydrogenase (short-subunit alcohol dehydrogenase family)
MDTTQLLDDAMEFTVVPSFTTIGARARSRLYDWAPLSSYDLSDRTVAITGATSGLGLSAAKRVASLGATVIIIGRDADRLAAARQKIVRDDNDDVHPVVCDVGDLEQVHHAADAITQQFDRLDALVHNAGALLDRRTDNAAGIETTVAAQVLGPFALTTLLAPLLRTRAPGRVITMSSGGMYTAPLTVADLQMPSDAYRGSEQYARAKRAQVTLNESWAERTELSEIVFHALHPGWADTPGVTSSLPTFAKIVGPLLRSSDEGADTMVWLVADDEPLSTSGDFWLDRRRRPIHRLARTRRSDTPQRRQELWDWCVDRTGHDPFPADDRT